MFIRKFEINGVKGINEKISLYFAPGKSNNFDENIEKFNLERNIANFSVLKQIGFIGLNSSGKTSILFGIVVGVTLLLNTNDPNIIHFFSRNKNLFSKKPISCKIEIVTKSEDKKILAKKYLVEYKYDQRQIIYEKVSYAFATKTTMSEYKPLYEFKDKIIYINGQKTNIDHNPIFSLFSLIRSGQINKAFFGDIVDNHPIFRQFNTYNHSIIDHVTQFFSNPRSINIPSLDNQKDLLLKLLQVFDNKISDIYRQPDGKEFIVFKSNGHEKEVPLQSSFGFLSSGTMSLLANYRAIMNAIFSNNIILFDEMGQSVHFGLFRTYFEVFRKTNTQLFFTTYFGSIFKQNIRLDQLFNVKNIDGKIIVQRLSEQKIDPRYINQKKVMQALDNFPDADRIIELLETIEQNINEKK